MSPYLKKKAAKKLFYCSGGFLSGGGSGTVVCYGGGGQSITIRCGEVVFLGKHFHFCLIADAHDLKLLPDIGIQRMTYSYLEVCNVHSKFSHLE